MNILGFIEIRRHTQLLCIGTNITQGRMGGFFHHIAQVPGKLQLAGAIHHVDFYFQCFAANRGPGKAGHQSHLITAGQTVRQIFANTQEGFQVAAGYRDFFCVLPGEKLHIRFAAQFCQITLQITNAGFPGIAANDLPNGIIRDLQLTFFQAVLFQLLGNQMILCDHQLLFIRIRAQLNDLHTVQQRPRDRIQGIRGGDKQHIGKVKGDLNVVIPVGAVLFPVQHLQQGRTGIPPIVGTHFINLVQQDHRVGCSCLGHSGHNPAGHSAHISFSVAADVRLIMNAAQRNTNHFPVETSGDGIGNGGLSHTGRAHQTQNLVLTVRRHLAHRHGFQNPLLHLLHSKVVMIQNLSGADHIHPLPGLFVPGQIQDSIQIIPQNRGFRGAKGLLFQFVCVFQQLFLLLFPEMQRLNPGNIFLQLRILVLFSKLFPDGLYLLTQIVIPLVLVHVGPGFILDLAFQLQHFNFLAKHRNSHFQPFCRIELTEKSCLVLIVQSRILTDGIRQKSIVLTGQHFQLYHLGRVLRQLCISGIQRIGLPPQGLASR